MSATDHAPEGGTKGGKAPRDLESEEQSAAAHRYFRAIEDCFISLRGSPLLLSPADHLLAREWFEQGIPLEVVTRALDGLFTRRRERGTTGKVSSLRYCRPAVEKEWKRVAQLQAADVRAHPSAAQEPEIEVAARLALLCAQLPDELPKVEQWRRRITALSGEPEAVEQRLAQLDRELLSQVTEALSATEASQLAASVERSLRSIAGRLSADQLSAASARLRTQLLRRRLGLPLLTLFEQ